MADQGQSGELLWTSEARLSLLGPVRLGNSAGDDLTPKARKTRALLALVALSKAPVSRSRLADLLWGDRGEEQAKASLRQALYELRWLASGGYLVADRHSVGAGGKPLPSDLAHIQRLIDSKQADELADALEDASCPPLADLDDITPELDDWLRDERPRLCAHIANGSAGIRRTPRYDVEDISNAGGARDLVIYVPNRTVGQPSLAEHRFRNSHARIMLTFKQSFGGGGVAK